MIDKMLFLSIIQVSLDTKYKIEDYIKSHKNYKDLPSNVISVYERLHNEVVNSIEDVISHALSKKSIYYNRDNDLYRKSEKLEHLYQRFVEDIIVEKYGINIRFY